MKNILFTLFCLVCGIAQAQLDSVGIPVQAPVIRQTTGGAISIYSSLDTAVINAIDGDTLFLPGGTFYLNSNTPINKRLAIFGTGYNSDSSRTLGKSRIMGTLYNGFSSGTFIQFGANAKGSFFCGIHFDCHIQNQNIIAEPMYFSRCQIKTINMLSKIKLDFRECVLGNVFVTSYSEIDASNSVFEGYLATSSGVSQSNLRIRNSILLASSLYITCPNQGTCFSLLVNFSSSDISDSFIFLNSPPASRSFTLLQNNQDNFRNCLFVGDSTVMNSSLMTTLGNSRQPQSFRQSVFVHFDDAFLPSSDYHLLSNSPYTDKGIYSGLIGKFRATPPLHISGASVVRQSNGQLKIVFGVQNNTQ